MASRNSESSNSRRTGKAYTRQPDRDPLPSRPEVASRFRYRGETISLLILLSLALAVRLLYQHESVVNKPLQEDAGKYFAAAYNLNAFGVHSVEKPQPGSGPPQSRTYLSPVYPLFLTMFLDAETTAEFEERVLIVQAILGTLTTALTFLLARLALGLSWATLAGLLTAVSPHLVVMDGYILTESLFTFVITLGAFILALSWSTDRSSLALIASLLLAVSARVRLVAFGLQFFLAPVFLLDAHGSRLPRKLISARQIAMVLLGFVAILGVHREFVMRTTTHRRSSPGIHRKFDHAPAPREAPSKRVAIARLWANVKGSIRPPNFFIKKESHIRVNNRDKDWKRRWEGSFWDQPLAYLKWNLGARLFYLWHWDNPYNGDVYVYPMIRKGFSENSLLAVIHRTMYGLHWPLFLLALAAPIVLLLRWWRGTLVVAQRLLFVPALVFVYFLGVLSLLSWLPRYTIPARPFSYILAAASLSWLASGLRSVFMRDKRLNRG